MCILMKASKIIPTGIKVVHVNNNFTKQAACEGSSHLLHVGRVSIVYQLHLNVSSSVENLKRSTSTPKRPRGFSVKRTALKE